MLIASPSRLVSGRSLESFKAKESDGEFARLKHEHFERKRKGAPRWATRTLRCKQVSRLPRRPPCALAQPSCSWRCATAR